MKASTRWFGWTTLMLPFHMSEQLIFGIGELEKIRRVLDVYYGRFQQPDYGTVVLVTLGGTLIPSLIFAILVGDRACAPQELCPGPELPGGNQHRVRAFLDDAPRQSL